MRVTFPHIGNAYIGLKSMFQDIGTEVIVPPKATTRTISLATKFSPEGVCIPFKLNLGNMIEALDMGADTILNATGHGTCRMGYYFKVQEQILRNQGYKFDMLLTGLTEHKLKSFMRLLKKVSNNASWGTIIRAFRFGMTKINILDDIEIMTNKVRATEREKGNAARIYRESVRSIDDAGDYKTLNMILKSSIERLTTSPRLHFIKPLHFLIVGEIYVVLDPFANGDIEFELGKLGVITTRSLYISRWTKNSLLGIFKGDQWKEVHKAAMPYLKRDVGGDGWETVGEKVVGSRIYDGMIHLAPFTCMPEGIAQNIMPVTKEKLPVLAIYCDEQTSKAGTITRLEAFVDMIRFKSKANSNMN